MRKHALKHLQMRKHELYSILFYFHMQEHILSWTVQVYSRLEQKHLFPYLLGEYTGLNVN